MMDVGKEVFNKNVLEFMSSHHRSIGWQPADGRTNHIVDEKLYQPTKLLHLSLHKYIHTLSFQLYCWLTEETP